MSNEPITPPIDGARIVNEHVAARYLGVSVSYLRKSRAGRGNPGPAYLRVGTRGIKYDIRDLEAWLASRRVEVAS